MKKLIFIFQLLILQNVISNEHLIEYKLEYFNKTKTAEFIFNSKENSTFSKNCFDLKKIQTPCIAQLRIQNPVDNNSFSSTIENANIAALTCENNLKGEVIYYKSESNTLEGFCYFNEDQSAVSLPTIERRYNDIFIKK